MTTFSGVLRDLRYSSRTLLKNKAVSLTAVLAFALGIGANTAIFSVVNSVLLRPLEYANPDQLVVAQTNGSTTVSPADFLDWQAKSRSFTELAAAQYWGAGLTGADKPEWVLGIQVTPNLFRLLGIAPALGRTFLPEDGLEGSPRTLVISHRLWLQRFGGDPGVVGRVVSLDDKPYVVTGVMPKSFAFAPFWATKAEMWTPLLFGPRKLDRGGRSLRVFGRLRDDSDLRGAQSEMDTISHRLAVQYPKTNARVFPKWVPLHEMVVGNIRPTLLVLLGTVGFVLLIACANVANLMLARVSARRREMAVRLALGANRGQLLWQLVSESMLLALLGGVLGVLIANWGVSALAAMLPEGSLPRQRELGLDYAALWFTVLASVTTGLLAGLIPGWQASSGDVQDALKEGGRGANEGRRSHRMRAMLVASEIALAFVLLIGAGLMIRSFRNIQTSDAGFDPHNLLTLSVSVAGTNQSDGARRGAFYDRVIRELAATPGVKSVSAINHVPVAGDMWNLGYVVGGRPAPADGQGPSAVWRVVRTGYFQTMSLPIVQGRDFTAEDRLGAPLTVIVNESLARRQWPGESAIGKQIAVGSQGPVPEWLTVMGVAKDAKQSDWVAPVQDETYIPFHQSKYLSDAAPQYTSMTLVIRTLGDPIAMVNPARTAVWNIDRTVRISNAGSMEHFVEERLWRQRVSLMLLGIFAGVALILAVTGIYAVISHSVSRRTHEIGVRMALGAQTADVIRLSLRDGMAPVIAGVGGGVLIASVLSRLMTTMLYQVTPLDPLTFGAVAIVMVLVALTANYIPARRATAIDPLLALRQD